MLNSGSVDFGSQPDRCSRGHLEFDSLVLEELLVDSNSHLGRYTGEGRRPLRLEYYLTLDRCLQLVRDVY